MIGMAKELLAERFMRERVVGVEPLRDRGSKPVRAGTCNRPGSREPRCEAIAIPFLSHSPINRGDTIVFGPNPAFVASPSSPPLHLWPQSGNAPKA
jgi:hypothetical protein